MATKILAIDDSKTMRLAIKITFAAEDAEVTSVSKGSDAVARINRFPFLQTGTVRGLGSLVPLNHGSATSLFGPPAPVVGTD